MILECGPKIVMFYNMIGIAFEVVYGAVNAFSQRIDSLCDTSKLETARMSHSKLLTALLTLETHIWKISPTTGEIIPCLNEHIVCLDQSS